jgi:hypothetical protein
MTGATIFVRHLFGFARFLATGTVRAPGLV